jgi:DNA (cytosine-5)-methyltransferase 1
VKYFSTFTEVGGLDWGLEKIGAECVGFSEIKESSVRIYLRHYPERKNFGDITKIKANEIPDFDILTGGFPCQSFSITGKRRGFTDRRGQMIFYLYDILMEKKPKYAVFENVKGIFTHDNGKTIKNVVGLIQSAGYFVRIILLNSAHYGSAQSRERVFFLCSRDDDFLAIDPEIINDKKRFRDFRDNVGPFKFASPATINRLEKYEKGKWKFSVLGGYDRVNTLTTGVSTSGRLIILVQENDGNFRNLTSIEGERLQGFPDEWTDGESETNRWFAIGNAVNCKVSEYLFSNYLKKVWGI